LLDCQLEVLIVEDDEGVALALRHALHYAGVACAITLDGSDALEALGEAAQDYAAVVVDQHLPLTTGTALLVTIRDAYPHLARVLTTGQVTAEVREAQADHTVEMLLEKPWSTDDLSSLVRWLYARTDDVGADQMVGQASRADQ